MKYPKRATVKSGVEHLGYNTGSHHVLTSLTSYGNSAGFNLRQTGSWKKFIYKLQSTYGIQIETDSFKTLVYELQSRISKIPKSKRAECQRKSFGKIRAIRKNYKKKKVQTEGNWEDIAEWLSVYAHMLPEEPVEELVRLFDKNGQSSYLVKLQAKDQSESSVPWQES